VFVDTPGILEPRYMLQTYMKKEVESSFVDADIIVLVIDASKYKSEPLKEIYEKYDKEFGSHKIFCIINKIDLLTKDAVLMIIEEPFKNL
jgi:GTPase